MKKPAKSLRNLSESYVHQINVLKIMSGDPIVTARPRQYDINEIAELSGLRDEKEIQRYLFILEGQKLVSPYPAGDFTSKTWQITKQGLRTIKTISRSIVQ